MPRSSIFRALAQCVSPYRWDEDEPTLPLFPFKEIRTPAITHLVAPSLAWKLLRASGLEEAARFNSSTVWALNLARTARFQMALETIGRALNERGIPPLAIKGAALLVDPIYPDPAMRFMSDLDLLVEDKDLDAASVELERLGFAAVGSYEPPVNHRHLPALAHPEWGVSVELHREALPTSHREIICAEELCRSAVPLSFGACTLRVPKPAHQALLTIAHSQIIDGGHQRHVPLLRALVDVAAQHRRHGAKLDWDEVGHRFDRVGDAPVFENALALLSSLFAVASPIPLPPRSYRVVANMDRRLDRSLAAKALELGAGLTTSFPSWLRRPTREKLEAWRTARWRSRMTGIVPPWT